MVFQSAKISEYGQQLNGQKIEVFQKRNKILNKNQQGQFTSFNFVGQKAKILFKSIGKVSGMLITHFF